VVFGAVVSGNDVVRAVEKVGSQSGKTAQSVEITACGELQDPASSSSSSSSSSQVTSSKSARKEGDEGDGESPKKKKKKKNKSGSIAHTVGDIDA
jgi:cyclophilin family peptidyl-prolyl cis-trans isomerase